MPESRLWIDTQRDGIDLSFQLPLNRLEFAFGKPLANSPESVLATYGEALKTYVQDHVAVSTQGVAWSMRVVELHVVGWDASAELEVVVEARTPANVDPRHPVLVSSLITHEVKTHRMLVFLRNDWQGGFFGGSPRPLGELNATTFDMLLPLGPQNVFAGMLTLVKGGAVHIAEGADHLLFLLLLIAAAPLIAKDKKWVGSKPSDQAFRHVLWIVTAFTLGHTITLVLGSSGALTLPTQPVEVAVAVTVLLAAFHLVKPLFPNADATMALVFGLIHGMAFSATLTGAGLGIGQHAVALLLFNLGIELMQAVLVLALLPPFVLIVHATPGAYTSMRLLISAAAIAVSILWIFDRLNMPLGIDVRWIDDALPTLKWVPAVLWVSALGLVAAMKRSH